MIVDIHAHIGSWFDFLLPEPSAAWAARTNERIGIVVSGISHLDAFGFDTRYGNEQALLAAQQFPGQFGVWLTANPYLDDVALVRAQLQQPYVWGLKLHPDVQQYPITGRAYEPYLALAEEFGVTILSHGQERSPWSAPAQIGEVARRHPGSPYLLGHAGLLADGIDTVGELVETIPNLYAEFCGSRISHHFLERLVEVAGVENAVFGSDACFLDQRWGLGRVLYSDLSDDNKSKVLSGNARRILGNRLTKEQP